MSVFHRAALAVLVAATAASGANALVIKPTGATASSSYATGYGPENTINGTGLSGSGTDVTQTHAPYALGNHWTTRSGDLTTAWIEWSFTTPQSLGAIYIWNHGSNGGHANNSGYEPILFDLTFYDDTNAVLLSWNDVALLPDIQTAQKFDFALLNNVSRVRFDVEAVQSSRNYTGLGEVAFDTTSTVRPAVPEPATWAMMIGGLSLVGASMRRRTRIAFA